MTLKLIAKSKDCCEPEELILREGTYGLGRLHDNDVSIQIDCVSGYHAELKRTTDGGYAIIDLHSSNGTFLNEKRVTSPVRVNPGDHLKLGNVLLAVEEHIEVVLPPANGSTIGGYLSKVISLKDEFDFTSEESFCTFPIAPIKPIRTQPTIGNVNEVLKQPLREEAPQPEPGVSTKLVEQAREAERAQQLERAREAERLQQIERAKEAERAQQLERAREAERAQQLQRAREAERAQQLERAREAERAQQLQRAREAERAQQLERAREAEQAQQLQRTREAERAQQLERAREAERAQQLERAREAERLQRAERAKEAEQAEADLRERPVPAGSDDFRSKFQNLTAQLENAMREIKRLKGDHREASPPKPAMNSHAAPPANPGPPVVRRREDHATQGPATHLTGSGSAPNPVESHRPRHGE